ncbi:hypothetical protein E1297_16545 [Roseibium sp. RKSG952]|nr:hypothetical protein [Roseibium sp. RKSG952]
MKLSIPLAYTVVGKRVRHRNEKEIQYREWVDIDVLQIEPSEAPVAVRVTNAPRPFREGHQVEEVRFFEGDFLYPANMSCPVMIDHFKDPQNLHSTSVRDLSGGSDLYEFFARESWLKIKDAENMGRGAVKRFDPTVYKSISRNERESRVRAIHEKAQNIVIIDGQVWVKDAAPVLALDNFAGQDAENHLARVYLETEKVLDKLSAKYHFSPTISLKEIAAFCDDASRAFRDDDRRVRINTDVEVLMPEVLDHEIEGPAFLSYLRNGIVFSWRHEGFERSFDQIRDDVLIALLQLKKAVFTDNPDMGEIESLVTEFVDLASDTQNNVNYLGVLDTIQAGLERWQDRPLALPGVGMP